MRTEAGDRLIGTIVTLLTTSPGEAPAEPRRLTGHRRVGLGASPFATTAPAVAIAVTFGLASLIWLAAGDRLPGGRWIVVHLFTLGVITPLIWTFSTHFAAKFNGTSAALPSRRANRALAAVLGVAIVTMLTGRALALHVPLVVGSLGIMAVIATNLRLLGRLRPADPTRRFAWITRQYRQAHVAFLIAASLGGALGAGWIPGAIYVPVREAHIHLNVLGWGGLTVLATLVVFGPALLRVRMEPHADAKAAQALQVATLGLGIATAGFVVTSLGEGAVPAAIMTAGGLGAYAYGVATVALPLLRASRGTDRSPLRWAVASALIWFFVAVGLDAVLVLFGVRGWSRGIGVALLIGVLAQLVLAVVVYVGPMLRGRDLARRDRLMARVERLARTRTAVLDGGVAALVVAQASPALGGPDTAGLAVAGWVLVALAVLAHLGAVFAPVGSPDPDQVHSAAAARYREDT